MSVEVLVHKAAPTLGEGPHWEPGTQTLLNVDILTSAIYRWHPQSTSPEKVVVEPAEAFVGFAVPRRSGGYAVGHGRFLVHLDWETGAVTKLAELDEGQDDMQINDGKCDAKGRVWAGTCSVGPLTGPEDALPGRGSLYSVDTDGTVTRHRTGSTISNGIAWSPDNKTMFFVDSTPRKVFAFDFDLDAGTISNERVCVDFGGEDTIDRLGYPDGLTIDTDGKLWLACFGAGKVIRFDPHTGSELQSVSFPANKITSCCFGGRELDELYVTSSQFSLSDNEPAEEAGSIFRVTGLGVKGFEPHVYEG